MLNNPELEDPDAIIEAISEKPFVCPDEMLLITDRNREKFEQYQRLCESGVNRLYKDLKQKAPF